MSSRARSGSACTKWWVMLRRIDSSGTAPGGFVVLTMRPCSLSTRVLRSRGVSPDASNTTSTAPSLLSFRMTRTKSSVARSITRVAPMPFPGAVVPDAAVMKTWAPAAEAIWAANSATGPEP